MKSGQGGPCDHCGRTQSCCWRRGPANKPVLCNACGSRYLVKRNLDNYVPLATRNPTGCGNEAGSGAGKVGARRAAPLATGRVTKPKRGAQKRVDSDDWSSDPDYSVVSDSGLTDDSGASSRRRRGGAPTALAQPDAAAMAAAQQMQMQAASELKLNYITTQMQLKELDSANFATLAFFASSLRLKPRKPLVVTVSAVW